MKTCLKANSKQSVKFRNGLIKFDNNYADFESVLKKVQKINRNSNAFYT